MQIVPTAIVQRGADQLVAELRAGLGRSGQGTGLQEPADPGHDAEGDLEQLAHGEPSFRSCALALS